MLRRVRLQPEDDVLVDRDRQRVGPLEDHADRLAQLGQADVVVVDVLALDDDLAVGGDVPVALVDPVEAAQQGRLAAARGADQRGDDARLDVHAHLEQRLEVAVEEVDVPGADADRSAAVSAGGGLLAGAAVVIGRQPISPER